MVSSEASGSLVQRGTWITQETDDALLRFASELGLVKEVRTLDLDGKPQTLQQPNISEAIRVALELFFEGRKGR